MLNKSQFDVLHYLLTHQGEAPLSQRTVAGGIDKSLGSVNALIKELTSMNLIDKALTVTPAGLTAMEPYKVDNAIIMAAGMSSRFAPLSYEKPKALLKVKGEILIEREIRQLHEAGIEDITLVVGYMKEKLFYLEEKFGVNIVVNPDYHRYNNTSTLMLVKERLKNSFICSSDNYFEFNPFEKYVYKAYYSALFEPGKTDEYCMTTDTKGRITKVSFGGSASWFMIGHAYFDRDFSNRFVSILEKEYESPVTKAGLWEDLYTRHIRELDMVIRKYPGGIREFDSLDELRTFDSAYITNTDSFIFNNICSVLGCECRDIENIIPIKSGLTNLSFKFSCKGKNYVYRHPGANTEEYIDRHSEAEAMAVAKELKLDETFIHIDKEKGWKISYFIEDAKTLDYHDESQVKTAMTMLRTLHNSDATVSGKFDIWKKIGEFADKLNWDDFSNTDETDTIRKNMEKIHAYLEKDAFPICLCHCDSYDPNFLLDKQGKMYLIDWEYAGMSDAGCDLGTFIACSDYTVEEAENVIAVYLGRQPTPEEKRHFIGYTALVAYFWYLWALYQEKCAKHVGDYLYIWYKYSKQYSKLALELYNK